MKTVFKNNLTIRNFLYVFLSASLISCDENQGVLGWKNIVDSEGLIEHHKVIEIEGCEYIMYDASEVYSGNGFLPIKEIVKIKFTLVNVTKQ